MQLGSVNVQKDSTATKEPFALKHRRLAKILAIVDTSLALATIQETATAKTTTLTHSVTLILDGFAI